MTGLASPRQLRLSLLRWVVVCVPLVVLLGSLSGSIAGASADSLWFTLLDKPAFMPPIWLFAVMWTALYAIMGYAAALILNARGAHRRAGAIWLFIIQLGLNLAWAPLFFGAHQIGWSLVLIGGIFVAALLTTLAFWRIRRAAGMLLIPYLLWLSFAGVLNWAFLTLNPDSSHGGAGAIEYRLG